MKGVPAVAVAGAVTTKLLAVAGFTVIAAEPDGPELSEAFSVALSALNSVVASVVVLTPAVNETEVVYDGAVPSGAFPGPDQTIVCEPV